MKTTKIALAAFCLLLAACTAEVPDNTAIPLEYREFTASVEVSPTRTSLDGMSVKWDESGEQITMIDSQGNSYTLNQTAVSSDRSTATFSGNVPQSGLLYAIYPAQSSVTMSGGSISFNIPAVQTPVENSFASATAPAISKVSDSGSLSFKNVCGLVGFTVNANDITSIKFSATEDNDGALAGPTLVSYSGSVPQSVCGESTGSEEVELSGTIQSGKKYWALVAPGEYYDLKVVFTNSQGRTATFSTDNTMVVERSKAQSITPFTITDTDWDDFTEPGGTAMLTYSEASSFVSGYNSPKDYTNSYGTWAICTYNGNPGFQLNKDKVAYIGTPSFEASITSIILTLTSDSGTSGNIYFCPSKGSTSQPSGSLTVSCKGKTGEYDVSSLGLKQIWIRSSFYVKISSITVVWGSGGSGEIPDDPDPDDPDIPIPDPNGLADFGWFELPAQTDKNADGRDDVNTDYYYSHTMRADAPRIRNFSSCYSKSKLHPVWVAAPMHNCYIGSSGRNDAYKNDPAIPFDQAPKWSGYTRGHMLGSSDRTVSKETNKQVFYYSNIGAQLQSGFNTGGGAWNNLESVTDGQWCSDTLYQVIGCIFQRFTTKDGNITVYPKTVSTSPGVSSIPTAWYKVLLRTKKGNTGKRVDQCSASELKCAAFILPHFSNAGHKPTANDLYTVEQLEALTGLTFFVNVPNAPKSTVTASDWGL
ncbi:MAG: DNA/RNA non-specific endonuclease [Bacteroidales bacterium]|nr:DNA/RNA non-specific endonuclease [Bacteroidales bacterium]